MCAWSMSTQRVSTPRRPGTRQQIGRFRYIARANAHTELLAERQRSAREGGSRLNAHTELQAKRRRSARETLYRNRPIHTKPCPPTDSRLTASTATSPGARPARPRHTCCGFAAEGGHPAICSGRGSTAARGKRGSLRTPLCPGTCACCRGRRSTTARGTG